MVAFSNVDPMTEGLRVLHISERDWSSVAVGVGFGMGGDVSAALHQRNTLSGTAERVRARQHDEPCHY